MPLVITNDNIFTSGNKIIVLNPQVQNASLYQHLMALVVVKKLHPGLQGALLAWAEEKNIIEWGLRPSIVFLKFL